ncbi:hypothetical protein KUTeg_021382 [Tegillarca granosa]|uniref:MARVEL domain-containing protein n=1 Tax=Tegillarca granosa TaxID=220873 RepID=A0ABQ9EFV9_TEGGR|nr:hypothetical protein KUTeg_021382 [Tegillarca granosa]
MSSFNVDALKEPRGFIKFIEWILSIFAFATTTSVSTYLQFKAGCLNSAQPRLPVAYPFDLTSVYFQTPLCPPNVTTPDSIIKNVPLLEGAKSSAEFYVFVGVIVFLYCIAAIILYTFFDDLYRKNNAFTIADFVISVVLTLLWLISSSAWAQGLVNLKYYTDLNECGQFDQIDDCKNYTCTQTESPNFASLNVSIIEINVFSPLTCQSSNIKIFLKKQQNWFTEEMDLNMPTEKEVFKVNMFDFFFFFFWYQLYYFTWYIINNEYLLKCKDDDTEKMEHQKVYHQILITFYEVVQKIFLQMFDTIFVKYIYGTFCLLILLHLYKYLLNSMLNLCEVIFKFVPCTCLYMYSLCIIFLHTNIPLNYYVSEIRYFVEEFKIFMFNYFLD